MEAIHQCIERREVRRVKDRDRRKQDHAAAGRGNPRGERSGLVCRSGKDDAASRKRSSRG
jgi:hypothetical protein